MGSKIRWYQLAETVVTTQLKTRLGGLSETEVLTRQKEFGPNSLPEAKPDSLWRVFWRQFQSPLIYLLVLVSIIVFFLQEPADSIIIVFILLFNAVIGTLQEGRAQNTLYALKKFTQTTANVIRDGISKIIPDAELVAGDIVVLKEGQRVPADIRLFTVTSLKIDESSLTGESEPIVKSSEVLVGEETVPVAEQTNMVFRGTSVMAGSGSGVVVAIGIDTALGAITKTLSLVQTEIPLQRNIKTLSRVIIIVVGVFSGLLLLLGVLLGMPFLEILTTVIALAVSVIPEGLPVVITLILATGVWRMSKRNALVKRLQAVEALGGAQVIAVDKTGTITQNQLMITEVFSNGRHFFVSGSGFEPSGNVTENNSPVFPVEIPELLLAGKLAAFCADAELHKKEDGTWQIVGDATEAALLVFSQKLGFKQEALLKNHQLLQDIPFDYRRKYHATVHQDEALKVATVVGAPEAIFALSNLDNQQLKTLEDVVAEFSKKGLRVLACGRAVLSESFDVNNPPKLSIPALFGMQDALHPEVPEAVKAIKSAGLKVVMITGDHALTAQAIASQAGIYESGDKVISGIELASMTHTQLLAVLPRVTVFARVTPADKLTIVQAYQKLGMQIAMTGDGVNDAPSLVAADLGISMGRIGTEVAKEASDIILLDDNFATIQVAIEEGRSIYLVIKRVLLYLFSTSIGEAFAIVFALILAVPLPVIAVQILWLNFVTDGFLTIALGLQSRDDDILQKGYKKPSRYLLDKSMLRRMVSMGLVMSLGTLGLLMWYGELNYVRYTTIGLTVLAVFQWFNAWNCRSETGSIFKVNFLKEKYLFLATAVVVGLQILAVYHPVMQRILHTSPLSLRDWWIILLAASSVIILEELRKFWLHLKKGI